MYDSLRSISKICTNDNVTIQCACLTLALKTKEPKIDKCKQTDLYARNCVNILPQCLVFILVPLCLTSFLCNHTIEIEKLLAFLMWMLVEKFEATNWKPDEIVVKIQKSMLKLYDLCIYSKSSHTLSLYSIWNLMNWRWLKHSISKSFSV